MSAAPPDEPPASLSTLPDALIQHIFTYLDYIPDVGRALCTSTTTWRVGRDGAVWMQLCVVFFGLTERCGPGREPVESYLHAARAWYALFRRHGNLLDIYGLDVFSVPPPLVEGASVTLTGLTREELNGKRGRAVRQVLGPTKVNRWEIQLAESAGESLSIKADNLVVEGGMQKKMAPLWERASAAWGALSTWAERAMPGMAASIGGPADQAAWEDFHESVELSSTTWLAPFRAVWTQHNGQNIDLDLKVAVNAQALPDSDSVPDLTQTHQQEQATLGLAGGYCAYSHLISVRLFPLKLIAAWTNFFRERQQQLDEDDLALSGSMLIVAATYRMEKYVAYDLASGELSICSPRNATQLRAVPATTRRGDDLLVWLEELGRRVASGTYVAEVIDTESPLSRGLSLFPRNGPLLSRAVTRGIEVEASALYAPEQGSCIYSIRLQLLPATEEGGLTEQQRGFATCQLRSRHWVLSNDAGRNEEVRGDGVVGRYPVLRVGGYRDDTQSRSAGHANVPAHLIDEGADCDGVFVYQSMSGRGGMRSFGGELTFVPGTLRQPAGQEFKVTVARFPLSDGAEPEGFLF